jgi:hypothetical protein
MPLLSDFSSQEECNHYLVLRMQSHMQELAGGCTIAFGVTDTASMHACEQCHQARQSI